MLIITKILLVGAAASVQAQDPGKAQDPAKAAAAAGVQAICSKYSSPSSYEFKVEARVKDNAMAASTAATPRPPAREGEKVAYAKEEGTTTECSAEGTFQSGKPGKIEGNGLTAYRSGNQIACKGDGERWVVTTATPLCPQPQGESASLSDPKDRETLAILASIPLPHEIVQALSGHAESRTATEDPGILSSENTVFEWQLTPADLESPGAGKTSSSPAGTDGHPAMGKNVCVRLVCDADDKSLESIEVFVLGSAASTLSGVKDDDRHDQLMKVADSSYIYKISDLGKADPVDVPEDLPALNPARR